LLGVRFLASEFTASNGGRIGDGTVLVTPNLSEVARKALGVDDVPPLKGLRNGHQKNLAAHRARHGFKERGLISLSAIRKLALGSRGCST
jgi:hypothetical protein